METQAKKPINWTNIIIVGVITAGLVYWLLNKDKPVEGTTITTTETIDYEKLAYTLQKYTGNQIPETKPFIVTVNPTTGKETIVNVKPGTEGAKELNVYKDTTIVEGAKIYNDIIADGKVYQVNTRAEIEQKTITKTITEKVVLKPSGLFITGGAYINPDKQLNTLQGGLQYIYKGDVGIGANIIYDTGTKQPYYGITISKKLF